MKVLTLEEVATNDLKPYEINGLDSGSKHGKWTSLTLLEVNNNVELYSLKGRLEDNYQTILDLDIKVVFASLGGGYSQPNMESDFYKTIRKLKSQGVIFFTSIGNTDSVYPKEYSLSREFINVAGVNKRNEHITSSIKSDLIDFASLGIVDLPDIPNDLDFKKTFVGTSFATPHLTGLATIVLQRFKDNGYDLNQDQLYKFMKDNSKLYGNSPIEVGNGVFVIPKDIDYGKYAQKPKPPVETPPIENGGNNMQEFKDVDKNRWSYKAIEYCVDKGLMKGYSDGTFRPKEQVTREELAQVLLNQNK